MRGYPVETTCSPEVERKLVAVPTEWLSYSVAPLAIK